MATEKKTPQKTSARSASRAKSASTSKTTRAKKTTATKTSAQKPARTKASTAKKPAAKKAAAASGSARATTTAVTTAPAHNKTVSPQPMMETDARNASLASHIGAIVLTPAGMGWVAPLVTFLMFRERSTLVRHHSVQELNLQITSLLFFLALSAAGFLTFGAAFLLAPLAYIAILVFQILASIAASKGNEYRYPIAIPFLR